MANLERGEVTLEVEGRRYTLVLPLNAICELETTVARDGAGPLPFPLFLMRLNQGRSFSDTRAFLYAALRTHHPKVTLESAGNLIEQAGGIDAVFAKFWAVLESAKPDEEDDATSRPPMAPAETPGTGEGSTSRPGASA